MSKTMLPNGLGFSPEFQTGRKRRVFIKTILNIFDNRVSYAALARLTGASGSKAPMAKAFIAH